MKAGRIRVVLRLVLWLAAIHLAAAQSSWLGAPESIAPGVDFFQTADASLVDSAGPIAVFLLRLDPARVRLDSVLSNDEVVGAEPVQPIAQRHRALAAINAGFFNVQNGEPVGLLKVAGELVSDTPFTKGVVAIRSPPRGKTELAFDQVSVHVTLRFKANGRQWMVPIDGVDTTRERSKLMLYTPAYHADTDTAANGTEWVARGRPLKVVEVRSGVGHTPIPHNGVVLSYGGVQLPEALAALGPGQKLELETSWKTLNGLSPKRLDEADHIVNGNGLLRLRDQVFGNWDVEHFSGPSFMQLRHPRTLIGVDRQGFIWLIAVDGRQPEHSIGMSFAELQRLCERLQLRDALNLDGGGSTTMVIRDRIVNRPSDATGPRAVSDAILVTLR